MKDRSFGQNKIYVRFFEPGVQDTFRSDTNPGTNTESQAEQEPKRSVRIPWTSLPSKSDGGCRSLPTNASIPNQRTLGLVLTTSMDHHPNRKRRPGQSRRRTNEIERSA